MSAPYRSRVLLPLVLGSLLLSGENREWAPLAEESETAFYLNYASHAVARMALAMALCVLGRAVLRLALGEAEVFAAGVVASDVTSCVVAGFLPTRMLGLLASLAIGNTLAGLRCAATIADMRAHFRCYLWKPAECFRYEDESQVEESCQEDYRGLESYYPESDCSEF